VFIVKWVLTCGIKCTIYHLLVYVYPFLPVKLRESPLIPKLEPKIHKHKDKYILVQLELEGCSMIMARTYRDCKLPQQSPTKQMQITETIKAGRE
jgi:hypothetical protein